MGAPLGNQNAKQAKRVRDKFIELLNADGDLLTDMCTARIREAKGGNVPAFTAVRDSIDGKPAQAIVGDSDEPPVMVQGFVKLVRPGAKGS